MSVLALGQYRVRCGDAGCCRHQQGLTLSPHMDHYQSKHASQPMGCQGLQI